jgi:methyl-accepting chemotaxis protein
MKTAIRKFLLTCAGLSLTLAAKGPDAPSPDEALQLLTGGNTRFVSGALQHPHQDGPRRSETVSAGQHPFATVLSCSDSRGPVEVLFDQGVGDVFVVRVAGNVASVDEIGSVEYGVGHLHTPLLLVLGHTKCGAVTAVVNGDKVGANIAALVHPIIPAAEKARHDHPELSGDALVGQAVKENVWQSVANLLTRSEEVRELVHAGKLKVVGAVYDLEAGTVNWMGQHPQQDALLKSAVATHGGAAGAAHGEHAVSTTAAVASTVAASHGDAQAHKSATTPAAAPVPAHVAPAAPAAPVVAKAAAVPPPVAQAHESPSAHAEAPAAAPSHESTSSAHAPEKLVSATLAHKESSSFEFQNAIYLGLAVVGCAVLAWFIFGNKNKESGMTMTIGKRIVLGFTAAVVVTATLGLFAYTRLVAVDALAREITTNQLPSASTASKLEARIIQAAGQTLQHVLAPDAKAMDAVESRMRATKEEIDKLDKEYQSLIADDSERRLYDSLGTARAKWLTEKNAIVQLSRAMKKQEASELYNKEGFPAYSAARDAAIALAKLNEDGANKAGAEITTATTTGKSGVVIGIIAAVVAAAGLGFFIIRGVNKALNQIANTLGEGSEQVASASSQVSSSSQSLAQGASEQAASLEETSSSLEEMSSMTKKNADTAQKASVLSSEAKQAANKGNSAMTKMSTAINEIQKSASETAKVLKVIDEIAFQTNLLALNAAVEAARAGEAGKGFAVVAEEVRNLAMRSAEAAKNTAAMIEESVQNSRNGVNIATEVSQVLTEITGASEKVNTLISEIAAASNEQAQGIGQVNTAVAQMDKVTQQNAANAEESAAASEELTAQAEQMNGVVRELLQLVGGATKAAQATHQPARQTAAPSGSQSLKRPPAKQPAAARTAAKKPHPSTVIPLDENEQSEGSGDFSDFNVAA